ncbi:hypothetical protein [Rhodococcus sp. 24CO]|uniref:hypothetical protein n=1 Tax=Rhodococcus sp. 24CO TaxID=3117460 RepID=UPI003D336A20
MSKVRRRYRIVDENIKDAAIGTAVKSIKAGESFTAACAAVADVLDVSDSAVRSWVNASGLRPQPSWEVARKLQTQLDAATELTRRLEARLGTGTQRSGAAE